MALKLITSPDPIVTWGELDQHLRLSGDEQEKALVETFIAAATQHLDGWSGILGRAIGPQTWELTLDEFPCGAIRLPLGPLISVTSVKHDDPDGDEQTIAAENYDVDDKSMDGWVVPVSTFSWPSTLDAINAVRVRFVAGYASVPAPIKAAVLLLTAHWYENREAVGPGSMAEMPLAVDRLIAPYRRIGV